MKFPLFPTSESILFEFEILRSPAWDEIPNEFNAVGIATLGGDLTNTPYPCEVGLERGKHVKFKKGDTVIYPQHGACIVHGIKRMKAFGATQEYLILKTVINEMTLSVPTSKANQVGVRPPVSKSELEDLRSVLSKADPRVPANWSRRFKNHQEKLKSGDVYQVAEVVRNLAARDRDSALSAAEKTMYDRARINLISEISPALKVSSEKAEEWLDHALEEGVLKPSKAPKKPAAKPVVKSPVAQAPIKVAAKKK